MSSQYNLSDKRWKNTTYMISLLKIWKYSSEFIILVYEVLIFFMFFLAAWKINQKWQNPGNEHWYSTGNK